ncbi:MAG: type I methionyl aminopeptidase [Alphaproteobacteria bacterium]|nr:type I methionyl aminopeptidase [Alphaproteobacteria bacterium]
MKQKNSTYSLEDFAGMRKAGRLAAETLDYIIPFVVPGVTTGKLDEKLEEFMRDNGGIPATLGYHGYPKASCISANHIVCHGIPSDKRLYNGDIINIDITPIVDGWYGDTSRMFFVGDKISVKAKRLVSNAYASMMAGIEQAKAGNTFGDIGYAINQTAEKEGFTTVKDYCGHGVGQVFHDTPNVLNYGTKHKGLEIKPGMIFTVEPMVNFGGDETLVLKDDWTVVTKDRSLSAQFEHSIGITETGIEIFTLSPKGLDFPPYK